MAITFTTELAGSGTASAIIVPADMMARLGTAKRYPVVVTIGDYRYRNSVSWYKGAFMISVSSAIKAAAGLTGGDEITVTVEHDTEPRVLDLPEPVADALAAAGTLEAFRALSYSRQRGLVEPWSAAKSDATRDKNLERILTAATG
ncbi:MAG: YdeI/OmpD-associated family protein [Rhodoglobus sp.]